MIKLSLLIPTVNGREKALNSILKELERQCNGIKDIGVYASESNEDIFCHYFHNNVQCIIYNDDRKISIGEKRNKLLELAQGEYVASIDDDDAISDNYVQLLLESARSGCDCASLKGEITINGGKPEIFEHSLKYSEWKTNPKGHVIRHERFPNHLNLIKASIAKQFKFPEKNYSEDHEWSKMVHESGLIKTEHYIPEVLYFYKYISNK